MDTSQYMGVFADESREHLQILNTHLLKLEETPDEKAVVDEIFRAAHTLKGMSATMGFNAIAELTHEMENVLDSIRVGKTKAISEVIDVLFASVDLLGNLVNSAIESKDDSTIEIKTEIEQLRAILAGDSLGAAKQETPAAPRPPAADAASAAESAQAVDLIKVNEFEKVVLKEAYSQGYKGHQVDVQLDEGCLLKVARVFMVFRTLENFGDVIKSVPSVQELEDEKFDYGFSVLFVSQSAPEEVENSILSIAEIVRADIHDYDLPELAPDASEDEEAAAAGRMRARTADDRQIRIPKTVRVDIERLDKLMNLVGEMVLNKTRLERITAQHRIETLGETVEDIGRVISDLQNLVMKVRMVPMEQVFNRFPRMVRDLSRERGKEVKLIMSGEETELDRTVIDEIGDPLVHIIRNSIDHGIEPPDDRAANGKPRHGIINLKARHEGNHVFIEVTDDGRGINSGKLLTKALERGLITREKADKFGDEEALNLVFLPGFSTAAEVSDISGRGVGMDVVRNKIESLSGSVEIESRVGAGTAIIIKLPLTLAIIQALLVNVEKETYAVPLGSIDETIAVSPRDIRMVQDKEVILLRGDVLSLIRLRAVLDLPEFDYRQRPEINIVVTRVGDRRAGFVVDGLVGQQEIVIKSLGKLLSNVENIAGAMIQGDGAIALILDVASIV